MKNSVLEKVRRYFEENSDEQIREAWDKYAEYDKIGPKVDEFFQFTENNIIKGPLEINKIINEEISPNYSGFFI